MSRPLAAFLYAALCVASVALWLSHRIDDAVTWACPCGGGHR